MSQSWDDLVDHNIPAEQSIILRYHKIFERLRLQLQIGPAELAACSMGEGVRLLRLAEHRGVEILVCDESSLMATGTFKDLDACVIAAMARRAGLERVVLSSGGNLGYSLSAYGRHSGMHSFFFHPKSTLYKLDAANFTWGGCRLICADLPERQVKSLAQRFAEAYGIALVPDIRWRLAASAARAMFILEATASESLRVDCIAQTMCAGYGPAGIYHCFSELAREGLLRRKEVPRFLGFQQEANAPMVRAWRDGEREIRARHIDPDPDRYLEPGLYNTNPERNYTRLHDLMSYYGGDLEIITQADYELYSGPVQELLAGRGIELTRAPGGREVLEKTALLTGVGILKAIDQGRLHREEQVLYMLTGGLRRVASAAPPTPDLELDGSRSEDEWLAILGERFGLRAAPPQRRADLMVT